MKYLITGAAGLIGSHMCDLLLDKGHEVIGVDDLSFGTFKNLEYSFKNYPNTFKFMTLKVGGSKSNLQFIPDPQSIDIVMHFAAYKKAPKNSILSSDVMIGNSRMMFEVIEFCQKYKCKLLFSSTSDIYGNHDTFSEADPITIGPPTNPRYSYAISKLFDEQLVFDLVNESKLNAIVIRLFGCFSERSAKGWSGGHIPVFIEAAKYDLPITIHGDGLQTRSMIYAPEAIEAIYLMLSKWNSFAGQIVNIGTDEEMSVKESANYIKDLLKSNSKIDYIEREQVFGNYAEINRRWANTTKLNEIIDWKPKISTKEAIKKVIEEWI